MKIVFRVYIFCFTRSPVTKHPPSDDHLVNIIDSSWKESKTVTNPPFHMHISLSFEPMAKERWVGCQQNEVIRPLQTFAPELCKFSP